MTLWSHPGGYQRNRQESDDLNTKGSIQISYLRRQNDDGEVVMTISQGWGMLHIVPIQMPYKTRAKCPHRELAVIPNSHPNSLARDRLALAPWRVETAAQPRRLAESRVTISKSMRFQALQGQARAEASVER